MEDEYKEEGIFEGELEGADAVSVSSEEVDSNDFPEEVLPESEDSELSV